MGSRVAVVDGGAAVGALVHPVRIQILDALREPAAAATVARAIGQTRQNVRYHLRELERAGLVEPAGEVRKGNFVEQRFRAVASTFLVSPRLAWGPRRTAALAGQVALEHLVGVGEHLATAASALLDRAAFAGEDIPAASVEAEVRFPDAAARSAFMQEYLELVGPLLRRHGASTGGPFRVALAVYPDPDSEEVP